MNRFHAVKIDSKTNKIIKLARRLQEPKRTEKEFVAEGFKLLEEALKANVKINCIIIEEKNSDKLQQYVKIDKVFVVSQHLFSYISKSETPQGILAIVEKPKKPAEIPKAKIILVVDKVQDPGNLGTIIRTSLAFGVKNIILTKGTVNPYNPKVVRSTMGAIFHANIMEMDSVKESAYKLRKNGYSIYIADAHQGVSIDKITVKYPLALIMSSEAGGIDNSLVIGEKIKIPIAGSVESLNVAVAASILLYELSSSKEI